MGKRHIRLLLRIKKTNKYLKKHFQLYFKIMYRLKLRSRNRTNQGLKDLRFNKRVVFRMGSTTPNERISKYPIDLEINTVEGCANCMDKRTMKHLFEEKQYQAGRMVYMFHKRRTY